MVGPCRLCGAVGDLQDSHILPGWVFRRILRRGTGGQSVTVEKGTRRFANDEDSEHLLCKGCEQRFSTWERHVSLLALQPDGTSPALRAVTLRARRMPGQEAEADGSTLGNETALFAASVVWRSHVRSRPDVRLGPYAGEFHAFVSGRAATLDHARLLVHVIDPKGGPLAAEIGSYPASYSGNGYRKSQFLVPGLAFTFRVGGVIPTRNDALCFIRTKRVWVIDGDQIAQYVGNQYRNATPVGRGMRAG